jgi:hypothetical protein
MSNALTLKELELKQEMRVLAAKLPAVADVHNIHLVRDIRYSFYRLFCENMWMRENRYSATYVTFCSVYSELCNVCDQLQFTGNIPASTKRPVLSNNLYS